MIGECLSAEQILFYLKQWPTTINSHLSGMQWNQGVGIQRVL